MKRTYSLYLLVLLVGFFSTANAQETIAKFKYEDAEKAFEQGNYATCIAKLDEAEKILGKTAPNILYLRIMAETKLLKALPVETVTYPQVERVTNLCNQYLQKYNIEGLEEKYRDVYDINNAHSQNEAEFERRKAARAAAAEQAREDKMESLLKKKADLKRDIKKYHRRITAPAVIGSGIMLAGGFTCLGAYLEHEKSKTKYIPNGTYDPKMTYIIGGAVGGFGLLTLFITALVSGKKDSPKAIKRQINAIDTQLGALSLNYLPNYNNYSNSFTHSMGFTLTLNK